MRISVLVTVFLVISVCVPQIIAENQGENTNPSLNDLAKNILGFPSGWSEDYPLTQPDSDWSYTNPEIATNDGTVHLVYFNGSNGESYYCRSPDEGKTWDKNEIITGMDDPYGSMGPDIAADDGSTVHVVWEDNKLQFPTFEILYRRSTDNGETWEPEVNISKVDNAYSERASIAANGPYVHIVWDDDRTGNMEIFYKRSTDGGVTWDDGLGNVGQDRQLTSYVFPSHGTSPYIAVNQGGIHVIFGMWSDLGSYETMYMNSTDNGATWSIPVMLSEHDTWHSYASAIAVNESGGVHVVHEESKYGNVEIAYINSTNNGITWNPEVRLSYNDNYSYQGEVAVNDSHVFVSWIDDRDHYDTNGAFELYFIESFDGGSTWSSENRLTYAVNDSAQPTVAIEAESIHIGWIDDRTNESRYQVFYKRYPDFPDTAPPDHTNETPSPDSYRYAPGTNISVHVTDPSGVNKSTIQLWVNGSFVSHNLTSIPDGYNVSYISPGFDPGVVECRIVADDNLSNHLDFTWNFTVLATYEIQLHEGWNLISVPHVQVDTAIDEVLRDIDGKWNYIQWYDASDSNDHWKTNATFKPQQLNDLFVINRTMAFWINITEPDVNLTVRGLYPGSTTIPLYRGWNLVGYPSLDTETVGNALFGTTADRVEVFNATAPYRIKEVGPTYVMKPGEGYWVHVVADSTWVVDW